MTVNNRNDWRTIRPEQSAWAKRLEHGAADKYLVVSCDTHVNEPIDFLSGRVDPQYEARLPRVQNDPDGTQWLISEAAKPQSVRVPKARADLLMTPEEYKSFEVLAPYTDRMETEDVMRAAAGRDLDQRVQHAESQGVDVEIVIANKGLLGFCTPDPKFAGVMCRAWSRCGRRSPRQACRSPSMSPPASIHARLAAMAAPSPTSSAIR